MGAHTALLTAVAHPDLVERLFMVEGGVGGGDPQEASRIEHRLSAWPVPFKDPGHARAFFGGQAASARAWADGLETRPDGLWTRFDPDIMGQAISAVLAEPAWAAWETMRQPTLLVLAERSEIDGDQVAEMLQRRPATRLERIAGAGHDVHLDHPTALASVLRTFLTSTTAPLKSKS